MVRARLNQKKQVIAVDPFYLRESKIRSRDFLFALLVSSVGDRPLGIQASQLCTVSLCLKIGRGAVSVTLVKNGESTSLSAVITAALESAIDQVELRSALAHCGN